MANAVRALILALAAIFLIAGRVSAAPATPHEARFLELIDILRKPTEERKRFVETSFSKGALERQKLDAWVDLLGVIGKDFGSSMPSDLKVYPNRVEAQFKLEGQDQALLFSMLLSPPPESKIDGIGIRPAPEQVVPVIEADLPGALANYLSRQAKDGFSGAVIVAKNGRPIFENAYGLADRAKGRSNTLDTPFNLASNNKMFTAVLISSLVEEGRLSWDGKVGTYLPNWPDDWVRSEVTIEQLLTHTSGLGDYWGTPSHTARLDDLDSAAEYADLCKGAPAPTDPGRKFRYSNCGYALLGLIAEQVTGRDYYDLVREKVYLPAGMKKSAHYRRDDSRSNRAIGYERDGSPNTSKLAVRGSPDGGGYASARDLLHFAQKLESGGLVTRETLKRMTTGHAVMGGPDMAYGYGFGILKDKEQHYGHEGSSFGANASLDVFPESGYVVVVLSNTDNGAHAIAQHIAKTILARK